MDFKVSYLDAGLTNSYFSDSDQLVGSSLNHSNTSSSSVLGGGSSVAPQRLNRRYKTQLRDFLSTCRTKRKTHSSPVTVSPGSAVGVEYLADTSTAAAVAAAYNMYSTPYPATPPSDNVYPSNFHQSLYDNRFLPPTDNLFHQYRPLGTYYTEYHHPTSPYVSNGFLDMSPRSSLPTYEPTHQLTKSSDCDKLYGCHQSVDQKYSPVLDNKTCISAKCPDYAMAPVVTVPLCDLQRTQKIDKCGKPMNDISPVVSSPSSTTNGLVAPKLEDIKSDVNMMHYGPPSEAPRQTVLMWGSGGNTTLNHTPASSTGSCRSPSAERGTPVMTEHSVPSPYLQEKKYLPDPLKSLAEMNSMSDTKWKPETPPSPKSYYQGQHYISESGSTEVWPPHHQYFPYHHHHQ